MELIIAKTQVRQDSKGRYNLNDLHKAAGGADKDKPGHFLANQQTKDLVAEILSDGGIPPSMTVKGGLKQGTYAVKELVYAYAMWISPSFHLKVIRTFDQATQGALDWRGARHAIASSSKVQAGMLEEVRKQIGKATEAHHYMKEHKLINSLLTGEYRGLDREGLTKYQLDFLAHFELRNAILIGMGLSYEQRKGALKVESVSWQQAHLAIDVAQTKEAA